MKLKLDENLGKGHAAQLLAAGHEVATIASQGVCGVADPEVLAACQAEGRCLVTLDLDFANPLVFDPRSHAGIVVLRLPPRPTPEHLGQLLETLCSALAARAVHGRLWIIGIGRLREYQPGDTIGEE